MARRRIVAERCQRRLGRGRAATERLWLRIDGERLVESHGKQLLFGREAPGVGSLAQIRPELSVGRHDFVGGRRIDANHARQCQKLKGLLQCDIVNRHRLKQRSGTRFGGLSLLRLLRKSLHGELLHRFRHLRGQEFDVAELDVGTKSPGFRENRKTGRGVGTNHPVAFWRRKVLRGPLDRKFVGRKVLRDRRGIFTALHVGTVSARSDDYLATFVVGSQEDGVDLGRVDVAEPVVDHALQSRSRATDERSGRDRRSGRPVFAAAEVEAGQPGGRLGVTVRDRVEVVFHPGRERVVDEVTEVLFQQTDYCEGRVRRDERRALLPNVAAVLHRADDRCVG